MAHKKKVEVFSMDRRDLLKLTGAGASMMILPDFHKAHAEGICDVLGENLSNVSTVSPPPDGGDLYFWIDGPMSTQYPTLHDADNPLVRIKLSATIDMLHSSAEYLEALMLTDANDQVLAAQAFGPEHATRTNRAPYAIFENIELAPKTSQSATVYKIYAFIRKTTGETVESIVKTYTLPDTAIRQSKLNYDHLFAKAKEGLPAGFLKDMDESYHGFNTKTDGEPLTALTNGYITTPYHHFKGLPTHNVRAKIMDIKDDGSFQFEIDMMHTDLESAHYMRYFMVLDPVGRVLGGLKRPNFVEGYNKAQIIERSFNGFSAPITPSASTLNILDCPFVQVLTEDNKDAIARVTFRLR